MSGIKPLPLTEFYRALRARGVSSDSLAVDLGVSGGCVRRLIGGLRVRRGPTWRGLLGKLQPRELELLMRAADVEQCSAWNLRQAAKRPRWNEAKATACAPKQIELSHP